MFKGRFPYIKRMNSDEEKKLKNKIFNIIFEADTPYGKLFDISLLFLIILSVGSVMLESIPSINAKHHISLIVSEWTLTTIFTIEYILRLYCVRNRWKFFFSFYGIIDLLSILPFFLGFFFEVSKYLSSIRFLRLLRIFKIFNFDHFTRGKNILVIGLKESRDKIVVFLSFVIIVVVVIGAIMYIVERDHPESGFTSIPISVYWTIVTLTTVGYGDISPVTALGQFLASLVMIIGYGIIAVPTGIVTVEMNKACNYPNNKKCKYCNDENHLDQSIYCKTCGNKLDD